MAVSQLPQDLVTQVYFQDDRSPWLNRPLDRSASYAVTQEYARNAERVMQDQKTKEYGRQVELWGNGVIKHHEELQAPAGVVMAGAKVWNGMQSRLINFDGAAEVKGELVGRTRTAQLSVNSVAADTRVKYEAGALEVGLKRLIPMITSTAEICYRVSDQAAFYTLTHAFTNHISMTLQEIQSKIQESGATLSASYYARF